MKKKKITLEYPINCTVASLFTKLSTDEGLESWFADRVVQDNDRFTFYWHKLPQDAERIGFRENKYVRFRWEDEPDADSYFEFLITPQELTGDVSLSITDFAEDGEYEDMVQMWESNVKNLRRTLGCRS